MQTPRGGPVSTGVLVGSVVTFVPFVGIVAPLLGGFAAGFRSRPGRSRGTLAGAATGVILTIPVGFLTSGLYANVVGWQHPAATPGIVLQEQYFALLSSLGVADSTADVHIAWFVGFVLAYVLLASTLAGTIGGSVRGYQSN